MNNLDNKFPVVKINDLIAVVLRAAHKRREDAGYEGRSSDGGARELEEQVKFYNYGRAGAVPEEWKQYANQLDPEYQEFLRLQQKFGK